MTAKPPAAAAHPRDARQEAVIHLNVPAPLKARWVRASRDAGQRLTDWIIARVDRPMPQIIITIPADVRFADLHLTRTTDGDVELDWTPIQAICQASGVDVAIYRDSDEDHLAELLSLWYRQHLAAGGERDAMMDDLIEEAQLEDQRGGGMSHQPGRA